MLASTDGPLDFFGVEYAPDVKEAGGRQVVAHLLEVVVGPEAARVAQAERRGLHHEHLGGGVGDGLHQRRVGVAAGHRAPAGGGGRGIEN